MCSRCRDQAGESPLVSKVRPASERSHGRVGRSGIVCLLLSASLLSACDIGRPAGRVLGACADPNNLPFSNQREEGFENRIARLLADELGAELRYTWWAQRRGFARHTLNAGTCDVIIGVPTAYELALTTRPYYRSTYVFATRADRHLTIRSFDDDLLRRLRIGVHLIGDDGANTPPVHALAKRGIIGGVRGYMIYGDYRHPNPPARLMEAVAQGEVDVAIAWGPLAGHFARSSPVPLELTPVQPQIDLPFLPMVYDISMAVRREDTELRDSIEAVLDRRRADIARILDEYGVPRVGVPGQIARRR